jgi:hypothetical protein
MSDSSEFITTIKQLMRLTREEKINWDERSSGDPHEPPTFEGTYENLTFTLKKDALETSPLDQSPSIPNRLEDSGTQYVLQIEDQSDNSQVTSPPMKAVRDLVQVIRRKPSDKKLNEINRRLGAS